MRKNGRRRTAAVSILLIVVITVFCVRLWPGDRSLLKRATRVTAIPNGSFYYWLSDHTILILQNDLSVNNWYDQQVERIFVYDTSTGISKDCPTLKKLFQATEGRAYSVQMSPDRQRLLWVSLLPVRNRKPDEEDFAFWVFCATLDSRLLSKVWIGDILHSHKQLPDGFGWLGNAGQWWETIETGDNNTGSDRLCVRTIGSPQKTVLLPFPADHPEGTDNALRFTGERLITYCPAFEGDGSVSGADEYHIGSKIEWVRHLTLPALPKGDDTYIASAFSWNGDKVSWLQNQIEPVPWLVRWLHRVVPSIPIEPHKVAAVFVCDLHSKHLTEIGIIDRAAPDYEMPLDHLAWTPDGHRLSFVYKNALYTTPVD